MSKEKQKMGFALLSLERRLQIASRGGRASHQSGNAHQWDQEEARAAGKKGGKSTGRNHDHMVSIGRKGGRATRRQRADTVSK